MLLSKKHMQRYIDLEDITADQLSELLTQAGHEVEGFAPILYGNNVVVGHVLTCEKHPDADTLNITTVDLGDRVEQIVCGAANIAQGQYVVVAQEGTVLKDMTIKPTSIRGIESNGMICSFDELGLADKFQPEDQKDGIIVLSETKPGTPAFEALMLDDLVFDVSQTSNRSDMMSLFNAAKELGALLDRPVVLPLDHDQVDLDTTQIEVNLETPLCSYFAAKKVNQLKVEPSPLWLRGLLIASGIKPINNLVDISNLVMLETGNPVHFYDASKCGNHFSVRSDIEGAFEALDHVSYEVKIGDAMIVNDEKPVGLAGIMGLGNTMIDQNTTSIIIEAARFDFPSVRKTATRLGLSTDASVRFSKPMDSQSTDLAIVRAVSLIKEICENPEFEPTVTAGHIENETKNIQVSLGQVNRLLGTSLDLDTIVDALDRLSLSPQVSDDVILTTIPSYRLDLEIAQDLIEEVIRIIGFDALPETLPVMPETVGSLTKNQEQTRHIESILLGLGANQVITYTLTDRDHEEAITLMNPISEKRARLRGSLFQSLLNVLEYNQSYQNKDQWLFEISAIYTEKETKNMLGMIGSGNIYQGNWTHTAHKVDFYSFKGAISHVLDVLGFAPNRVEFKAEDLSNEGLHPYQTASIYINRVKVGELGSLHPETGQGVYAELDLTLILGLKTSKIKTIEISKYPKVTQDIAVLVKRDVSFKMLETTILKAGKRDIVEIDVFDIFRAQDDLEHQSIAMTLTLAQEKTYSMDEVHEITTRVKEMLVKNHQAVIR